MSDQRVQMSRSIDKDTQEKKKYDMSRSLKKMQDQINMKHAYNTFVERSESQKKSQKNEVKVELEKMQRTYMQYLGELH